MVWREQMVGQFGYGLSAVSYFFGVFFLGKRNNVGLSLIKETQFICLLPISRRFPPLRILVAHLVGDGSDPRTEADGCCGSLWPAGLPARGCVRSTAPPGLAGRHSLVGAVPVLRLCSCLYFTRLLAAVQASSTPS